jgi:hypothetical protein
MSEEKDTYIVPLPAFFQNATEDLSRVQIELNRKEYDSFIGEYEQCGFSEENGGFFVCHPGHHFDGVKGDFERNVAKILYLAGNRVVLQDEHAGYGIRVFDGLLNDVAFEISSVESDGEYTIQNHLKKSHKKGASLAVIYFPSEGIFSLEKLRDAVRRYKTPKKTSARIRVWYIVAGNVDILRY